MSELAYSMQLLAGNTDEMFWPILGVVGVIAIIAGTMSSVLNTRQRELTRREVAAYVASGTIDKDTAVAILKAGRDAEEAEAEKA